MRLKNAKALTVTGAFLGTGERARLLFETSRVPPRPRPTPSPPSPALAAPIVVSSDRPRGVEPRDRPPEDERRDEPPVRLRGVDHELLIVLAASSDAQTREGERSSGTRRRRGGHLLGARAVGFDTKLKRQSGQKQIQRHRAPAMW